jgi:5-methylcytosine-specific restriction endonuclease McrA
MNSLYAEVAQRAGHRGEYCHAPEVVFNFSFEVEHITPTASSGSDNFANLALACRSCNLQKASRMKGSDADSQEEVRLFDPRGDRWEEHFQVDPESGDIEGRTAIGRATVV